MSIGFLITFGERQRRHPILPTGPLPSSCAHSFSVSGVYSLHFAPDPPLCARSFTWLPFLHFAPDPSRRAISFASVPNPSSFWVHFFNYLAPSHSRRARFITWHPILCVAQRVCFQSFICAHFFTLRPLLHLAPIPSLCAQYFWSLSFTGVRSRHCGRILVAPVLSLCAQSFASRRERFQPFTWCPLLHLAPIPSLCAQYLWLL